MKKLTPILLVEAIEPSVRFWVDRLGFEASNEVKVEEQLVFVILTHGSVEIMYQTRASVVSDAPQLASEIGRNGTCLYIEVDGLDEVIEKLDGVEVMAPRRDTFYGTSEIVIREPGGHFVTFAARKPQP